MQKIKFAFAGLILLSTSCVSLLSQETDEAAWNRYFQSLRLDTSSEIRIPSSEYHSELKTGIKILRQLLGTLPFRDLLISCGNSDCFESQLVLSFDEIFTRVKNQGISLQKEDYSREQKRFLGVYSFENVLGWVDSFHKMLFSGLELRTGQRALDFSNRCLEDSKNDSEIILKSFAPFEGGITYLPRSVYHCLNQDWEREVDQTLRETTERLGVLIKKEETRKWIIQKQIIPVVQRTLNEHFLRLARNEQANFERDWTEINPTIGKFEHWVSVFRKKYPLINVEALVTEKISQSNDAHFE